MNSILIVIAVAFVFVSSNAIIGEVDRGFALCVNCNILKEDKRLQSVYVLCVRSPLFDRGQIVSFPIVNVRNQILCARLCQTM